MGFLYKSVFRNGIASFFAMTIDYPKAALLKPVTIKLASTDLA
jgi:hypothetical protein